MLQPSATPATLPLLPHGRLLINDIPLASVDLDMLLSTITSGLVIVQDGASQGVIFIASGAVQDAAFEVPEGLVRGETAVHAIRNAGDAHVSIHVLDAAVAEAVADLLSAPVDRDGLDLEWIVWPKLVAAYTRRPGLVAFEVTTTRGTGVGVLRDGAVVAAYTDNQRTPAGFDVLDKLIVGAPAGSVRVRVAESVVSVASLVAAPSSPLTAAAAETPIHEPTPPSIPAAASRPGATADAMPPESALEDRSAIPAPLQADGETGAPDGDLLLSSGDDDSADATSGAEEGTAPAAITARPSPWTTGYDPFAELDVDGGDDEPTPTRADTTPDHDFFPSHDTGSSALDKALSAAGKLTEAMLPALDAEITEQMRVSAPRLKQLLRRGVEERWDIAEMERQVRSTSIRAVSAQRLASLADDLGKIARAH